jgi:cytochrome P450
VLPWVTSDNQKKKNQYTQDLEELQSFGPIRLTFPGLLKIARKVPLPLFGKVAAAALRVRQYARDSVNRYCALVESKGDMAPRTLFTRLWQDRELSFDDVRNEAQAYIIAGSDTTAVTLTYLVYAVCANESIRKQLLDELATLPEDFTDKDVRKLTYLDQVINETLRMYSSAANSLPRAVPPEGATLAGYRIPGGTVASSQAYSLHRRADIFEDPHKFDSTSYATVHC